MQKSLTPTNPLLQASVLRQVPPVVWSALLERFDDGSVYQSYAYGAVSWGARSLEHLILGDGACAYGIAQVRVIRLPIVRGVAYVRWGPCVQPDGARWSAEAFEKLLRALVEEYVVRKRMLLRVVPNVFREDEHGETAVEILSRLGFQRDIEAAPYRTLCVELDSALEVIRQRFDGKWRNQLNAAERFGLSIVAGTDEELFKRFVRLYEAMLARKRFDTTVDVRDFLQMQAILPKSQKMQIALAVKDGEAHAGIVFTMLGRSGIYLLGATGEAGLKTKASYLLQWYAIRTLKFAGRRRYDLGGFNPIANPGVYHFKAGMGGTEMWQLGRYERRRYPWQGTLVRWAERWWRRRRALARRNFFAR